MNSYQGVGNVHQQNLQQPNTYDQSYQVDGNGGQQVQFFEQLEQQQQLRDQQQQPPQFTTVYPENTGNFQSIQQQQLHFPQNGAFSYSQQQNFIGGGSQDPNLHGEIYSQQQQMTSQIHFESFKKASSKPGSKSGSSETVMLVPSAAEQQQSTFSRTNNPTFFNQQTNSGNQMMNNFPNNKVMTPLHPNLGNQNLNQQIQSQIGQYQGYPQHMQQIGGAPQMMSHSPNIITQQTQLITFDQKFGRAFQFPSHSEQSLPQTLKSGVQILGELKFSNPNTRGIINSMTKIPLQPYFDPITQQFYSRQTLFSQFSIPTQTISIEFTLTLPGQPKRKIRGIVNLQELEQAVFQSGGQQAACIHAEIPESLSENSYNMENHNGDDDSGSNIVAELYLELNVGFSQEDKLYLISDLNLLVEYSEFTQITQYFINGSPAMNNNIVNQGFGQGPQFNQLGQQLNLNPLLPNQLSQQSGFNPQALNQSATSTFNAQPQNQFGQMAGNQFMNGPNQQFLSPQLSNAPFQGPNQYGRQGSGMAFQNQLVIEKKISGSGEFSALQMNQNLSQPQENIFETPQGQIQIRNIGVLPTNSQNAHHNQNQVGVVQQQIHGSQMAQNPFQPFNQGSIPPISHSPHQQFNGIFPQKNQFTNSPGSQPNGFNSHAQMNYQQNNFLAPPIIGQPLSNTNSLGAIHPQLSSSPGDNYQQYGSSNGGNEIQGIDQQFQKQMNISNDNGSYWAPNGIPNQTQQYPNQNLAASSIPFRPIGQTLSNQTQAIPIGGNIQQPFNIQQQHQYGQNGNNMFNNQALQNQQHFGGLHQMSQGMRPKGQNDNISLNNPGFPNASHQEIIRQHQMKQFQGPQNQPNFMQIQNNQRYPQYPNTQALQYPQQTMINNAQTQAIFNNHFMNGQAQPQQFLPPNYTGMMQQDQQFSASQHMNLMQKGNHFAAEQNNGPQSQFQQIDQVSGQAISGNIQNLSGPLNMNPGMPVQKGATPGSTTSCNINSQIQNGASNISGNLSQNQPSSKSSKKKPTGAEKRSMFLGKSSAIVNQSAPGGGIKSGGLNSAHSSGTFKGAGAAPNAGAAQAKSEKLVNQQIPFHSIAEGDTASSNSSTTSEIPHFADLADYLCTQKGSRIMQEFLKKAPINSINLIIDKIKEDFGKLMSDSYGNYFCQSLLRSVGADQRLKILKSLTNQFVSVACDSVGTHSMQRLVEIVCEDEEKMVIFNSIERDIERLAFHHKGNYVLLTIIGIMRGDILTLIVDKLLSKFPQLMLDQLGICLVNKAIMLITEQSQQHAIIVKLAENIVATIQSPYGNYAITTALETWGFNACMPIMYKIKENFAQYAIHKFSSNVIEKCVERADQSIIDDFKTIIFEGESSQIMKMLLRSQHSFFIVGKIYSRLIQDSDRERMLKMLQENLVHAGDKLIKSKCVALINKGHQLGSGSKKSDLESTPGGGVGSLSPEHSRRGEGEECQKSSSNGSNVISEEDAQQIIDFAAEQKRKVDVMFDELTDQGVEEEKETSISIMSKQNLGEPEQSPKYAFQDPQDQQTNQDDGVDEGIYTEKLSDSTSPQKQQRSKINHEAEERANEDGESSLV